MKLNDITDKPVFIMTIKKPTHIKLTNIKQTVSDKEKSSQEDEFKFLKFCLDEQVSN